MPISQLDHLTFLYGSERATEIAPRLRALIGKYAPRIKRQPVAVVGNHGYSPRPLTQADALLITYGDQVREPGRPPLQTLAGFLEQHLTGVVTGVHLLPFYPFSSDDGFSVIDYLAVDPNLGNWEHVERIGSRFDLMFDAVLNHISAHSEWFQRFLRDESAFRDYFIVVEGEPELSQVVRPRALPLLTRFSTPSGEKKVWTTFSADQIDLNFHNPQVLLAVLEALLFYVARGARYIRLDAIAYLWKEIGTPCIHLPQTHRMIQLMRAVLDEVAPGVMLITETNVPHADNVSYFGDGTNEAQLVYNFALPPLVLHALATGNAEKLTRWAQSLALPSDRVTFFNFLASHDGIGVNPARGILSEQEISALAERTQAHGGFVSYKTNPDGSKSPYELNINYFDALSNPNAAEPLATQAKRFIVAQAIMLALTGLPGVYFHSLFGSRGDRAAAEASGIPRRINRQKLDRAGFERELADPSSLRSTVLRSFKDLLQLRAGSAAFHPGGWQQVMDCGPHIFALVRVSPDAAEQAICLHNVCGERVRAEVQLSDDVRERFRAPAAGLTGHIESVLQPYEVRWIQRRAQGAPTVFTSTPGD